MVVEQSHRQRKEAADCGTGQNVRLTRAIHGTCPIMFKQNIFYYLKTLSKIKKRCNITEKKNRFVVSLKFLMLPIIELRSIKLYDFEFTPDVKVTILLIKTHY